jgi:hypothetical protein
VLHLLQPVARLLGRVRFGLTPWRRKTKTRFVRPRTRVIDLWSETWEDPVRRLQELEEALRRLGGHTARGGEFDRWDLEVRGGLFGAVRILMAIEEHGEGRQMVRLRTRPRFTRPALILALLFLGSSLLTLSLGSWGVGVVLGFVTASLLFRTLGDCAAATAVMLEAVQPLATLDEDACD